MNELHRNPTIHPEAHLDIGESIALIGIANSVVAAMLKEIPSVDPFQEEIDWQESLGGNLLPEDKSALNVEPPKEGETKGEA